eukprot:9994252-Lingulodinium_polyedra.AAC.1
MAISEPEEAQGLRFAEGRCQPRSGPWGPWPQWKAGPPEHGPLPEAPGCGSSQGSQSVGRGPGQQ